MKLVIFGLTISSSWGNGHATIWRGLCRALARRGHSVVFFEKDVPYYSASRDYTGIAGVELCLYTDWTEVLPKARAELKGADAGMVTSYCHDAMESCGLLFSSSASVKAFYDLDTPVTLKRLRTGQKAGYIPDEGLKGFDIVLSYTGGQALEALKGELGAKRVYPLYGSVDPDTHMPVEAVEGFRADLSYLGTYAEDRQEALNELFVEPSRRLPGRKFVIGGSLYPEDFPWTRNIHYLSHVAPPAHPAFYSSSVFTLNVTRRAMAEMGYCPSGRLFEAAACAAPVLSDYWAGLESFFEPGSEITIVNTADDVQCALEMPAERRARITKAARDRTLGEHTAMHRAVELEGIIAGA